MSEREESHRSGSVSLWVRLSSFSVIGVVFITFGSTLLYNVVPAVRSSPPLTVSGYSYIEAIDLVTPYVLAACHAGLLGALIAHRWSTRYLLAVLATCAVLALGDGTHQTANYLERSHDQIRSNGVSVDYQWHMWVYHERVSHSLLYGGMMLFSLLCLYAERQNAHMLPAQESIKWIGWVLPCVHALFLGSIVVFVRVVGLTLVYCSMCVVNWASLPRTRSGDTKKPRGVYGYATHCMRMAVVILVMLASYFVRFKWFPTFDDLVRDSPYATDVQRSWRYYDGYNTMPTQ